MGPLAGIKVLDLSRILAGPWATQCLADFGATVWKIEKPGTGDDTRHWGPPWIPDGAGQPTEDSAYYASANRGKHSLAIDFTQPAGQQLIRAGQVDNGSFRIVAGQVVTGAFHIYFAEVWITIEGFIE